MNITNFRLAFPEFTDEQKYTDTMLTFWASIADTLMNETRWAELYTQGTYLFVAHNITLAAIDVASAEAGRAPGNFSGIQSNKSVGDVSVGYDTQSVALDEAGNFNLTKYGRDFFFLARIVGMGGSQV